MIGLLGHIRVQLVQVNSHIIPIRKCGGQNISVLNHMIGNGIPEVIPEVTPEVRKLISIFRLLEWYPTQLGESGVWDASVSKNND